MNSLLPTIVFVIFTVASIVLSIIATRPNVTEGKFTKKDVADYYNSTHIHYERWWGLKKALSLHYGIWDNKVKNFKGLFNSMDVIVTFIIT